MLSPFVFSVRSSRWGYRVSPFIVRPTLNQSMYLSPMKPIVLGEGAAANTYLDQEKLFTIIKKANVDAVHPGYGFLSENAEFAEACEFRNVIFLGPGPEQMKAFGLKHVARDLAKAHNVPLLPGTDLLGSLEEAVQAASTIGYPVMLKSTAGGGGIGMQLCYSEDELLSAYDSVKRLSENNFSNDGLFLEKFVERARHIEVQVFADGEGNAIALGERDCSSQRRNQKVIEEAPAPNLDEAVRQQLCEVAVNLLSAVKYRSAGTVEYVYDPTSEEFYFLEVNTRLQVEHGVTELVFGVDLVRWMVELGAKSLPPLEVLQKDLRPRGHAVQVRVYAENPHNNFQPSAGLLSEVVFPPSDGIQVRIDHWLEAGIEISPFFDPMLAKIICYGDSRRPGVETVGRYTERNVSVRRGNQYRLRSSSAGLRIVHCRSNVYSLPQTTIVLKQTLSMCWSLVHKQRFRTSRHAVDIGILACRPPDHLTAYHFSWQIVCSIMLMMRPDWK